MARTISDEELQLKRRARRRLIGAIVLVTAIVVALPMVLDTEQKPIGGEVSIKIPPPDAGGFTSRVVPVSPPAETKAPPVLKPAADIESAPRMAERPAAAPPPAAAPKPAEEPAPAKAAKPEPVKPAPVKPAAATPAAKKPASPGFVVQVVALADAAKAKQVQAQVAAAGIKSYTEVVKTSKGDVTRVRAGPFATRAAAEKARDHLKGIGLAGNVVPK